MLDLFSEEGGRGRGRGKIDEGGQAPHRSSSGGASEDKHSKDSAEKEHTALMNAMEHSVKQVTFDHLVRDALLTRIEDLQRSGGGGAEGAEGGITSIWHVVGPGSVA